MPWYLAHNIPEISTLYYSLVNSYRPLILVLIDIDRSLYTWSLICSFMHGHHGLGASLVQNLIHTSTQDIYITTTKRPMRR